MVKKFKYICRPRTSIGRLACLNYDLTDFRPIENSKILTSESSPNAKVDAASSRNSLDSSQKEEVCFEQTHQSIFPSLRNWKTFIAVEVEVEVVSLFNRFSQFGNFKKLSSSKGKNPPKVGSFFFCVPSTARIGMLA